MKVFQIVYGAIPEKIAPCLESVKRVYPQVDVLRFLSVDNLIIEGDKQRVDIVSSISDVLYLDWDIMLNDELIIPSNGLPAFNEFKGQPDYSIIYSPDKTFWKQLEAERIQRRISKNTYAWVRKLLRGKKVNILRDGFSHLRYSQQRKGLQ